jgi:hypothetical protein
VLQPRKGVKNLTNLTDRLTSAVCKYFINVFTPQKFVADIFPAYDKKILK